MEEYKFNRFFTKHYQKEQESALFNERKRSCKKIKASFTVPFFFTLLSAEILLFFLSGPGQDGVGMVKHHIFCNGALRHIFHAWDFIHHFLHDFLNDGTKPSGAGIPLNGLSGNGMNGLSSNSRST